MAVPEARSDGLLTYIPFEPPPPVRRIVLAWRKSFSRPGAVQALREAVLACDLPGVDRLPTAAVKDTELPT